MDSKMMHIILALIVGSVSSLLSIQDNRFFPWLNEPIERNYNPLTGTPWGSFYADVEGFALHSSEATSATDGDIGLFELGGRYDLNKVAQALESIGRPNPLKAEWRGQSIPFRLFGKLQGGGIRVLLLKDFYPLAYYYPASYFSVGTYFQLLKTQTRLAFIFDQSNASIVVDSPETRFELEQALIQANKELCLCDTWWNQTSFGDLDIFIRFGNHWEYPRKFKAIDFDVRLGVLAPFGHIQDINNPASVPIAGNGHIGVYGQVDVEFELKDDLKVGAQIYLIQRFPRRGIFRAPHKDEPVNFGVIVDEFQVDPRMTFVANPYVLWQDLRDGFGLGLGYTFATHPGDIWSYVVQRPQVAARLDRVRRLSSWSSEYLSVYLMYDFARAVKAYSFAPCVRFIIDAPIHLLGARDVSQTIRVSMGLVFEL